MLKHPQKVSNDKLDQVGIQLVFEDGLSGRKCLFPSLSCNLDKEGRVCVYDLLMSSLSVQAFLQNQLVFVEQENMDVSLGLFPEEMNRTFAVEPQMIGRGFQLKVKHQQIAIKQSADQRDSQILGNSSQLMEEYEKDPSEEDEDDQQHTIKNVEIIKKSIGKQPKISLTNGHSGSKNNIIQSTSTSNSETQIKSQKRRRHSSTKRSHERTIYEGIDLVTQWRKGQQESKIGVDLSEIAAKMGVSKKTLDYYFLEFRTAEFFGFDFDAHLDQRMGYLRSFIEEQTEEFLKIQPNGKIQRELALKYQLPKDRGDQEIQVDNSSNNILSLKNIKQEHLLNSFLQESIKSSLGNQSNRKEESNSNGNDNNVSKCSKSDIQQDENSNRNNSKVDYQTDKEESHENNKIEGNEVRIQAHKEQDLNLNYQEEDEQPYNDGINIIDEIQQQTEQDEEEELPVFKGQSQSTPFGYDKAQKADDINTKGINENNNNEVSESKFNSKEFTLKQETIGSTEKDMEIDEKIQEESQEQVHPYEKKRQNAMYQEFLQKSELCRQQQINEKLFQNE